MLDYVDRMDLAYAAADLVVCRAGAYSVTEAAATGLPAVFVPLPIGNGEQEHNARAGRRRRRRPARSPTRALTSEWVAATVPGLLTDPDRLAAMGAAASALIPRDADEKLARIVLETAGAARDEDPGPRRDPARRGSWVASTSSASAAPACPRIARIMAARGLPVTGSDDHDTPFLPSLRELGVTCHLGYDAEHLGDRPATPSWSPRPRARTTPRCSRPAGAACGCCRGRPASRSVMDGRRVLAVAGTHGKTTTTSLLTVGADRRRRRPDVRRRRAC